MLKTFGRKQPFYDESKGGWNLHSANYVVMCLGDLNGHVGRHIDGDHGGYGVGRWNMEGRMLPELCLEKELCVSNAWHKREEKRKVTFRLGENETKIDFVLKRKEQQNVKTISMEFQHALVVADINKK